MSKNKNIPRPSDDLPPKQLQAAWDSYLNSMMGKPDNHPRWESLMDPRQLEILCQYLDIPADYMKMPVSPKMQVYLQALDSVLGKLNLMQRDVIKRFYGLGEWLEPQTQEQIAKELISADHPTLSQQMIHKYLKWAKKNLKRLIRQEAARLAKNAVQEETPE